MPDSLSRLDPTFLEAIPESFLPRIPPSSSSEWLSAFRTSFGEKRFLEVVAVLDEMESALNSLLVEGIEIESAKIPMKCLIESTRGKLQFSVSEGGKSRSIRAELSEVIKSFRSHDSKEMSESQARALFQREWAREAEEALSDPEVNLLQLVSILTRMAVNQVVWLGDSVAAQTQLSTGRMIMNKARKEMLQQQLAVSLGELREGRVMLAWLRRFFPDES